MLKYKKNLTLFLMLLAIILAAGCGKTPAAQEWCGDGICDSKEQKNPKLCPVDCSNLRIEKNESIESDIKPPDNTASSKKSPFGGFVCYTNECKELLDNCDDLQSRINMAIKPRCYFEAFKNNGWTKEEVLKYLKEKGGLWADIEDMIMDQDSPWGEAWLEYYVNNTISGTITLPNVNMLGSLIIKLKDFSTTEPIKIEALTSEKIRSIRNIGDKVKYQFNGIPNGKYYIEAFWDIAEPFIEPTSYLEETFAKENDYAGDYKENLVLSGNSTIEKVDFELYLLK